MVSTPGRRAGTVISSVLCPIDFSAVSLRELELATSLCRAFGAKLCVHHNVSDAGPGVAMGWMWQQERHGITPELAAETRLRELLEELPLDVEPRAVITRGVAAPSIVAVRQQMHADLVLLGTHGPSSQDHASVTENVVSVCACPVLVLHDNAAAAVRLPILPGASPWTVLVATDLSPESLACLRYAAALALVWPLELHVLHVSEAESRSLANATGAYREEALLQRVRAVLPVEIEATARCYVRFGEPSAQIAACAESLGADCVFVGAHARGLLRGFWTTDTSRQVLQRTQCPTWVVPANWAA
jgi:nucleotide-binding universal stress UspA family protein